MPQTDSNPEEYATHCVDCYSTANLIMVAHHVDGKMIGWLFVCSACLLTIMRKIVAEGTEAKAPEEAKRSGPPSWKHYQDVDIMCEAVGVAGTVRPLPPNSPPNHRHQG